jgi:hypothetical protein
MAKAANSLQLTAHINDKLYKQLCKHLLDETSDEVPKLRVHYEGRVLRQQNF